MTNEDRDAFTVEMHDLPAGVQGLIQLGRNAIDRVSELERGIAYRDQMIRQLSEELDDLIKTDNETIRSLFAEQAKRDETVRQLRAQLAEYEQEPTVALLEWPAKSWPNLRLVSGAYATSGTSVELIARPTRKDGE